MDKVDKLIKELEEGPAKTRQRAADKLGKMTDNRAVLALLRASKQGTIHYEGRPSVIRHIIEALQYPHIKDEAESVLVRIGEPAINPMIQALQNETTRESLISALERMLVEGKPIIDYLTKATEKAQTHEVALWALVRILWDNIPLFERKLDLMVNVLSKRNICMTVAERLSGFGDSFVKPLIKVLELTSTIHKKDRNQKQAYLAAQYALAMIGQPAIESLIKSLEDDHLNIVAGDTLTYIGPVAVLPLTTTLKTHKNKHVRCRVARILGVIRDARAIGPLVETLERDEDLGVRKDTAEALGRIGDTRAIKPLLVAHENKEMQQQAAGALENIPSLSDFIKHLNEQSSTLLCANCLCRFEGHKIRFAKRYSINSFCCRKCRSISKMIQNIDRAIVVLDRSIISRIAEQKSAKDSPLKVYSESTVCNLRELSTALRTMKDSTYWHHVNNTRNDFATWVRDILGNYTLAEELENCTNRIYAALQAEAHLNALGYESSDGALSVNWFWRKELFDFDEVHITDADDYDVDEFMVKVRNDNDIMRHKRYRSTRVIVASTCGLKQAKFNLLNDTFGTIQIKDLTGVRSCPLG